MDEIEERSERASEPAVTRSRLRVTVGAAVVLVLCAAAVAVLVALLAPKGVSANVPDTVPAEGAGIHSLAPDASASASASAIVHVVGAVRHPGLYSVPAGSRVVDAIAAAGGFTPRAQQAALNLARPVADGEQLVVPVRGAAGSGGSAPTAAQAGDALVSLNSADLATLETLDGIGPALAQRILDYRQAHGPFHAVTDLQNVSGIGDKKFAAIKDRITL